MSKDKIENSDPQSDPQSAATSDVSDSKKTIIRNGIKGLGDGATVMINFRDCKMLGLDKDPDVQKSAGDNCKEWRPVRVTVGKVRKALG